MSDSPVQSPRRFATTRWSLVVAAGRRSSPDADVALETLCSAYWFPLYAYVRSRGHNANDARDLTQEFFVRLLEKDFLQTADPDRGRFRSFLLTVLKRFLSKEHEKEQALKRGGGRKKLSIDFDSGEQRISIEPATTATPESIFERQWALTLLQRVLVSLESHYRESGRGELFENCRVYLTGSAGAPPYVETAESLGMTEGALKVAVHRMRKQYRELLTAEVAQTVSSEEDVEDEIRSLMTAVARS
jgi:RNA polymerase sigma-70 factor (ECF subfamily)